jgi:hypothetical protein
VPNLLQGYALWKKQNPEIKNTYLLLHTHWGEGWNIHKLAAEIGVNPKEILTTYVCKNCGEYEVKPFIGQDLNCKYCGTEKSQTTTNVGLGVTEAQLNEIYNFMDVYCHPFTSGGQEIPIQEAKLTELITLVTNYSCGEEMCEPEANSFPLEWTEYREHGTEFIKASTYPESIAKQLNIVYKMLPHKRLEIGKKAREWTIKHFGVKNIAKTLEQFIDSQPIIDWDKVKENPEDKKDPYVKIPEIVDDAEWLIFMYHNILKMKNIDRNDSGHQYWMNELSKGAKRPDIENYFRNIALKENEKNKQIKFEDLLDSNDKGRVIYVIPESAGDVFLSTALFKSIKDRYPDYSLYVATKPQYKDILDGNPYVHRWIEYNPIMDNLIWLEGNNQHDGYFDIAYLPYTCTQRNLNYLHNGVDKLDFSLN